MPEASPQVTRENLLMKAIGKPGRCAAFLLARTTFLVAAIGFGEKKKKKKE